MTTIELKSARKQLGLTQAELGRELGVSRVYVGLMERGLSSIDKRTGLAVRYLLGQKNAVK